MQKRVIGKKTKEKKSYTGMIILGVIALVILFVVWGFMPIYGTVRYGVCRTYIELNVLYPQNLEFISVEEEIKITPRKRIPVVRMYYQNTGPFGEHWFNVVECSFRPDQKMGFALEAVDINRKKVHPAEDPELVERFNKTIPTILAFKPETAYPPKLPESIAEYK